MSLHSTIIANHVLESGSVHNINGTDYIGQLRRVSYKELASMGLAVGEIVSSLTLPRAQCDGADHPFLPSIGLSITMDGARYEITDMPIENEDYYRLTLTRYGT